jgi:hypothetical protein
MNGERWSCRDWSAWYNDEPGPTQRDPRLHVAAHCRFSSGSITWKLEPGNEGIVDDPERIVLQFTVDDPGIGTSDFVEGPIDWAEDVGDGIKVVEIRGDANVEIQVDRVT